MAYKLFDKKTSGRTITNEIVSNKELAEELNKPIIRKFEKRNVHSPFIDNIWAADLTDMQLTSKFNQGNCFLLCVIDIFSKYAWVIPLKDKKGVTITYTFQKNLKESNRKLNKRWVDKGGEFYNRSMKSWLEKNAKEIYSTDNEEKSVIAQRFIKTLKNIFYKYMTPISKNVYLVKLDDLVNKYNNTYHSTIKMEPADVKSNTYTNPSKKTNNQGPKFKIGDIVIISKYKRIFAKGYVPNWLEEVFVFKKAKSTVPCY